LSLQFAIYYDHEYPKGGKSTTTVLLDTGSWTEQDNCNRRAIYNKRDTVGCVMHRPKLFATAGGARNHLKTRIGVMPCYRIAKYTGPTNPNARPAIDYTDDACAM